MSHRKNKQNNSSNQSQSRPKPVKPQPVLDVAILTAGRLDLFSKCLDAVLAETQGIPSRIYICENGIHHDLRVAYDEVYKKLPEDAKVMKLHNNLGYPGGANRAIRAGTAKLVLFVTDDVILHPGSVNHLLLTMSDERIGICGMKLVFPSDSVDPSRPAGKVQHVGHAMNIKGEIIHPFMGWSADNPKTCVSRDVASVTGAIFMVRRAAFNHAGGFFEGYGVGYYEDADLCFTLRKLGYRVFIDAQAIATHYVNATMDALKVQAPMMQNYDQFRMRHQQGFYWSEWEML